MQAEDSRYRSLDRMLARAYIELMQKKKARRKQKAGFFVPRYAASIDSNFGVRTVYSLCRMDLCDDPENKNIVAMLEVPGMKPEQLSARIEGARLIIEGERIWPLLHSRSETTRAFPRPPSESTFATLPDPEAPAQPLALYPVWELKYGTFKREIDLPAGIDVSLPFSSLCRLPSLTWQSFLARRCADMCLVFLTGYTRPQHTRGGYTDHFLASRPHLVRCGWQPRCTRHPASRQPQERNSLSHLPVISAILFPLS